MFLYLCLALMLHSVSLSTNIHDDGDDDGCHNKKKDSKISEGLPHTSGGLKRRRFFLAHDV